MVSDSNIKVSEKALPAQLKALTSRFPEVTEVRQVPLNTLTDIMYGIDYKADTVFGKTLNVQFKSRSDDSPIYNDLQIPIKVLYGKEKDRLGCTYISKDGEKIPFVLDFKNANVISYSVHGNTYNYSVDGIERAFYRKHTFDYKEVSMYNPKNSIDSSIRVLFISPKNMFFLMLTDFLTTSLGNEKSKILFKDINKSFIQNINEAFSNS